MQGTTGPVDPFDLQRMLLGDLPWLFTLEVIVRTVVMYLFTVALIRTVSKRSIGQLSVVEFTLVIALGSAVGDPMFYPEVPLLHGFAVITVIVVLNRGMIYLINHNEQFETAIEGTPACLVQDGVLNLAGLRYARLAREKLFEKFRTAGIRHLGEIETAYIEQGGQLTVFRHRPPGLLPRVRTTPPWDLAAPHRYEAAAANPASQWLGCDRCCHVARFKSGELLPVCSNCGNRFWIDAVEHGDSSHARVESG